MKTARNATISPDHSFISGGNIIKLQKSVEEIYYRNKHILKVEFSFLPAVFLLNVPKSHIPTKCTELAWFMKPAARTNYPFYQKSHIIPSLEPQQIKLWEQASMSKITLHLKNKSGTEFNSTWKLLMYYNSTTYGPSSTTEV